jgi:transcriptional regulator with XRE-family HTH domain
MYHYTQCGLDNIYLKNGYKEENTGYGTGVSIYDIEDLHKVIARGIVNKEDRLTAKEFRFLRIEMDYSQVTLGKLMGLTDQQIANYEKSKTHSTNLADKAIRDLYQESINESPVAGLLAKIAEIDKAIHEIALNIEHSKESHQWQAKVA